MFGIVGAVGIGLILGVFIRIPVITENADLLSSVGLCLLLFFIGVDIGYSRDVFKNIKKMTKKVLLLPFIAILGSLFGGFLASFFLPLNAGGSVAVAAGMGWYSFSAIALGKVSASLGGIAFLTNVIREIFSIFLIGIISKKLGGFEAVGMCGATSMDSLLPIINRCNPPRISIVAFYSGFVISVLVPIIIPIIMNFL